MGMQMSCFGGAAAFVSRTIGITFGKWGKEVANALQYILLGTTNKMQHFTVFFIIVNAVHVSGRRNKMQCKTLHLVGCT
jgi:hypothetical protein